MIFAHLPAGYLAARLWRRLSPNAVAAPGLAGWGMIGGVIPDIDMFWAVLVDHGQVHHHRYLTHWPSFWLLVIVLAALVQRLRRVGRGRHCLAVFALGVGSHLFLDWFVSAMWLLEPISDASFQLVTVPASYRPWVLNFIHHWVGWLDMAIAATGAAVALADRLPWRTRAYAAAPIPSVVRRPAMRVAAAWNSSAGTGREK